MDNTNTSLYRLLKIRYNSFSVLFLFIHPIYALWLYSLGDFTSRQLNRTSLLNKISTIYMALVWTTSLIFFSLETLKHSAFADILFTLFLPLTFVCWIYSSVFVTKSTIDFENKNNDYMPSLRNYVPRFFILFYWLLGLWYVQKTINEKYNIK